MAEGRLTRADNLVWREIDDEIVVIKDDGLVVHVLNKTAARIWEMCNGEVGPDEIADILCERFDVEVERARTDVRNTVKNLREKGLLK